MIQQPAVLGLIADGDFHSGEALGDRLGLSRSAVWKQIDSLRKLGFEVDSVTGRGYRLRPEYRPLDPDRLAARIRERGVELAHCQVCWSLESTNTYARDHLPSAPGLSVVTAEMQRAGRGRRGRAWESSAPGNVVLSILHSLEVAPASLSGLSLVAGLSVAEVLREYQVAAMLKWPNDIMVEDRKLGGLLLEIAAETGGSTRVITGIGLNLSLTGELGVAIDQPWCCLRDVRPGPLPDRTELVAEVVTRIAGNYHLFLDRGFKVFLPAWRRVDYLRDQVVEIRSARESSVGLACGITETGDLRVRAGEREWRVNAGEVSVRRRPA